MKKYTKKTAIILSAILGFILIVGLIFSFVPMNFGDNTWVGLSNSINLSSDVVGGMYGEFDIKTEDPTRADIEQSKGIIRDVLAENGYKNANVYDIAGEKIRVELSYPRGGSTYSDVSNILQKIIGGQFNLQSSSSSTDSEIFIVEGYKYVDRVDYKNNNGAMAISIVFTEEGKEAYKELCHKVSEGSSATGNIYLAIGSNSPQEINIQNTITAGAYESLELQSESYEALKNLKQSIQFGCMALEFKENTVSINTMSASLSAGESASSPENASFFSSSTYVILISAIAFIIAILLVIFATKFGYYAILMFVTMLINTVLFICIICLIPSIEFGLSAFVAIAISIAVIYNYALDFACTVKKEYNNGKSLNAALETAYKNKLVVIITSNAVMFMSALAFILLSFGELVSVGTIFAISAFLSLLTNIFVVPFLIKICLSFDGFGRKLFMLKKRSISEMEQEKIGVKTKEEVND